MLRKFASSARDRMRLPGGGYRRDHLRALAQRVEVDEGEVRIMGSKGDLLRTLAGSADPMGQVPSFVPKWRRRWDSNPRWTFTHVGFQDRCIKPLCHSSVAGGLNGGWAILKGGFRRIPRMATAALPTLAN